MELKRQLRKAFSQEVAQSHCINSSAQRVCAVSNPRLERLKKCLKK